MASVAEPDTKGGEAGAAELPEGEPRPHPPAVAYQTVLVIVIVPDMGWLCNGNGIPWNPSPNSTFGWDGDL